MGSYQPFSDFSKLVMALLMWIGRLEVLPVLVLLTRGYWRVLAARLLVRPARPASRAARRC